MASTFVNKPLSETVETTRLRLMQCKVNGCTAMGPGTLTSILMAREHKLGSNVVVCTDGIANVGPRDD